MWSASMQDKETVVAKIDEYIDWLATPSAAFSGFPICPFVKQERTSGKLKYEIFEVGKTKSIFDLIDEWDMEDNYMSMIIAYLSDMKIEEYKKFQYYVNKELKKMKMGYIKVITLHPEEKFEVGGVRTRSSAPYFLVNVGYYDEFSKTHEKLKETKYFDNFTEENKKYLKV